MKTIEILRGNKLIVEFMKWYKHNVFYHIPEELLSHDGIKKHIPVEGLVFHESYDWIMLVVEKIESLGFNVTIKGICCKVSPILEDGNVIVSWVCGNIFKKRELIFITLVEFIKWYNSQLNSAK